ncbi:MAG TPA: extracellular solute-binding protein [Kiloniellales bacterium]|nr:extracellular solute-binding protein [Kiloniellales bacterium]
MRLTRRHVLGGAAALAGTAAFGRLSRQARAAVTEFRMIEAGGPSGESIEQGYIAPYTKKTGIKVIRESPSGLGKLRSMVEAKSVTAPLLELGSPELEQARALDLVEPLDWAAIDPMPIFPEAKNEFGFGYQYYSTIMAWNGKAKAPSNWVEFFDASGFPGKRALPDYPAFCLPLAAMGAGVKPEELYPLNLDAAFDMLESVKDHVAVWWQAGAQPPQLLKDNEVQYAISWSGRVAGQEGISISFNQGQLDLAFFAVPKGANPEEKAAAMGLLHEMSVPENQAVAAEVISYTGNSPDLEPLLPQDRLAEFPTTEQNRKVQVLADAKWWFENADEVETRWQEFKLTL